MEMSGAIVAANILLATASQPGSSIRGLDSTYKVRPKKGR